MKTAEGWIRGALCGKPVKPLDTPSFECALCGRYGAYERQLCFPVKINGR